MHAVNVGLSLVLAVCVAGFMAHRICWGLDPLSLKMVVRNSSSWAQSISETHPYQSLPTPEFPSPSC